MTYIHFQHSGVPLKIRRLAPDSERFIWAVGMAQSRCINLQVRIGALVQHANMFIPYAGEVLAVQLSTFYPCIFLFDNQELDVIVFFFESS